MADARIASVNPATGDTLREFPSLDDGEIDQRLHRAVSSFVHWQRLSISDRVTVVRQVADLLDADRRELARLMTLEMGKLAGAADDEIRKCALTCRWYADHAETLLAPEPVRVDGERAYVIFQPLGVILAVMPWNFPFWQVIRFAAPALCAGNVCLLKHASNVPQCALAIEDLFERAGAPAGVFQTMLVGSASVARLLADERVAAATLTGSEGAGASVAATAGKHLKKTVLELGGSDPFIVMPSADLSRAVETAVRARIINNGQSCIAGKRFIVHRDVAEVFERRFVAAVSELTVGDPSDAKTQVGPLATQQVVDDLENQVTASVRAGARVLTGGRRYARPGFYFQPTVLAGVPPEAPAYREELFGPVAALFRVDDIDGAIALANDTRFGLAASAWTREPREIDRFATELAAGSVFVNGMVASDPRFPFGGIKASGYGRELSSYGLREFTNVKTVRISL